jgi:Na+-translocating ferredoxin:NAD+ oxidoreductase RnfG subunit
MNAGSRGEPLGMKTIATPVRRLLVHACRVAVVAGLVWLVGAEHAAFLGRQQAATLDALPIGRVQPHLPEAAAIGGPSPAVAGAVDLLDAAGERVGLMFRTSPAGDTAIGFSGPTDLLVICDTARCVAGVEILASRDTRDHVAAIERDTRYLRSFIGRSLEELAGADAGKADAVAGSTLTCSAIAEALALRLGGTTAGGRFEGGPTLVDLRKIFPEAVEIQPDAGDPTVIRIYAAERIPLGWGLRTSPAADRMIGYQGPTDAVIGFDTDGRVAGVAVLASYDNEPYVGYVRDDEAFRGVYRGMTFEEVAGLDADDTGVEGVSGATMTSQAVARGIVAAAGQHADARRNRVGMFRVGRILGGLDGPRLGALGVIAVGIVTAFTRLRGSWFGRLALPLVVLVYLGFGAGALLSQAQLWGWAQAGVPRGAIVLAALAGAAAILPVTTRRNVYCSHLCAHGAAQQLLVRFVKPRRTIPDGLRPWFALLPWVLLAVATLTAVLHLPLALVDIEPFDGYVPLVAGLAAVVIFVASLAASALFPMAYCRHGCPTGALLDHLRFHGRADRLTWRDGILAGCLAVAAAVHWWPR